MRGQAVWGAMAAMGYGVAEGQWTSTVYGLIRDGKCAEAVPLLAEELARLPTSRPALSLLGYCHYYVGSFAEAAEVYEALTRQMPDSEEYAFYHAQCLYKAALHPEATKAAMSLGPAAARKVRWLARDPPLPGPPGPSKSDVRITTSIAAGRWSARPCCRKVGLSWFRHRALINHSGY